MESDHEGLGFGVSEAGVEFEHFGSAGGEHESGIEHAFEVDAVAFEGIDGGDEHFGVDGVHELVVDQGRGAEGTHAAGVGAGVIFANAFVILCGVEDIDVSAVDQSEDGHFFADESFFDDHGASGVAEGVVEHHLFEGFDGVLGGVGDDDAFAFGESGGFDDDGGFTGFDVGFGLFEVGEGFGVGGGDAGRAHEVFGVGLVGFELGGLAVGPEDVAGFVVAFPGTGGGEAVGEALGERVFGADDDKAHVLLAAEVIDGVGVFGVDRFEGEVLLIGAQRRGAGIAWGKVEIAAAWGLFELPAQGVFTPAGAEDEDIDFGGVFRHEGRVPDGAFAFRGMVDGMSRTLYVLAAAVVSVGLWVMYTTMPLDGSQVQDVYYIYLDAQRTLAGENTYRRIEGRDMVNNDKYATYLPGFYLLGAGSQALGAASFEAFVGFWRLVFATCSVLIGVLILGACWRAGWPGLGMVGLVVWGVNRWTLEVMAIVHIEPLALLPLVASVVVFRRHLLLACVLLSVSLAVKQIAVFMVPVYAMAVVRQAWLRTGGERWKAMGWGALALVGVPLAVSLVFLMDSPVGFFQSLFFSTTRVAQGHVDTPLLTDVLQWEGLAGRWVVVAGMLLMYVWAWGRVGVGGWGVGIAAVTFGVLMMFVHLNPVQFVQYFVWPLPFVFLAIAEAGRRATLQRRE